MNNKYEDWWVAAAWVFGFGVMFAVLGWAWLTMRH